MGSGSEETRFKQHSATSAGSAVAVYVGSDIIACPQHQPSSSVDESQPVSVVYDTEHVIESLGELQ